MAVSYNYNEKKKIRETTYTPSQQEQQYRQKAEALEAQRPVDYVSAYAGEIQGLYDRIQNREPFTFDLDGNALYQQYKDQYQSLGRLAMKDTMGKASALTGGYGSSYSQGAGQQAYNAYLQKLGDIVPELYDLAYDQYRLEGQALQNQADMLLKADDRDYDRWQDGYDRWQWELENAQNAYNAEREFSYGSWQDMLSYWQKQAAAEQAQANWQAEMDLKNAQLAASQNKASSGGSGKTGASSRKTTTKTTAQKTAASTASNKPFEPGPAARNLLYSYATAKSDKLKETIYEQAQRDRQAGAITDQEFRYIAYRMGKASSFTP